MTDSQVEFFKTIDLYKLRKRDFTIEVKGDILSLINDKGEKVRCYDPELKMKRKHRLIDGVGDVEAISFMAHVAKCYSSYIERQNGNVKRIRYSCYNVTKNAKLWESMSVGDIFVIMDIDNCYWQAAYRTGLINREYYERYRNLHNIYKDLKNRALAAPTVSTNRCTYKDGEPVKNENGRVIWTSDDKSIETLIYSNLKAHCAVTIKEVYDALKQSRVLHAGTDSITFRLEDKHIVDSVLGHVSQGGIEATMIICEKTGSNIYIHGNSGERCWEYYE
jgi:hypothetical protein